MFLAAKRGIPQRWRDHGRGTGWPNPPVLCSSVAEDLLRNLWFLLGEGERSCSLRMPSQGVQGATVFLMSGQWAVVVGGACKKNCFELREFVCLRFWTFHVREIMETPLRRVRVVVPWGKGQMNEPKAGRDSRRRSRLLALSVVGLWTPVAPVLGWCYLMSAACLTLAVLPVSSLPRAPWIFTWAPVPRECVRTRNKQLAGVLE